MECMREDVCLVVPCDVPFYLNMFRKLKKFFVFWLEDNCFTILCWFLPSINMNRPQVYLICPLPCEYVPSLCDSPSHSPPHPTPLGCRRALGWTPQSHIANSHLLSSLQYYSATKSVFAICLGCELGPKLKTVWKREIWEFTLSTKIGKMR